MIRPMAIQLSDRPRDRAGQAHQHSQPLMSEAPADNAVTKLPRLRPPRM